jgi:hypothetical protein
MVGLDLPAGSSWILTRLAKQGAVAGEDLAQAMLGEDADRNLIGAAGDASAASGSR